MFLTAKGAKSVRKGCKAFIYRRNFAIFAHDFAFFAVYVFLILLHIINFASINADDLFFCNCSCILSPKKGKKLRNEKNESSVTK
jgi:hypothetical protein